MLSSTIAGILVAQRHAAYKDQPGRLYHYPTQRFQAQIDRLRGQLVLFYEPRRGGAGHGSSGGGRMAFSGYAFLGDCWPDPADTFGLHAYVETKHFSELPRPVPLSETVVSAKALQYAVQVIPMELAEAILERGLAPLLTHSSSSTVEGLVDPTVPPALAERPIREMITTRPVREASFRLRVVADTYEGTCAISGLKLTNGSGRAEVDAAHIMPVERGGPDSTFNGLALSKTLHWAFDRGLISASDDGTILTVDQGLDAPIRRLIRPEGKLIRPARGADAPHPWFLRWHRENVFKCYDPKFK